MLLLDYYSSEKSENKRVIRTIFLPFAWTLWHKSVQQENDVIKVKAGKVFEVAISKPSVLEIAALVVTLLFLLYITSRAGH